jgi:hypothetical protein
VHLADGFVDQIAFRLLEPRIPFVVVTGYDRETLSPPLRKAAYVQKPICRQDFVAAVERCIQENRRQGAEQVRRLLLPAVVGRYTIEGIGLCLQFRCVREYAMAVVVAVH